MTQLFTGNLSRSYEATPAIWDHSVICHPTQVNASHHNLCQTGRYSTYLPEKDGRMEG